MSALPIRSIQDLQEQIAALERRNDAVCLEARRSAEQSQFKMAELEHRLMNTFATVQALVMHTARPGDTGQDFRAKFEARLLAMARSHELLGPNYPQGAPLAEVIGRCLQPYEGLTGQICIAGPAVHLPAPDVQVLGLAFHELSTNAAKHGALSVPKGRVEVFWRLEAERTDEVRSVLITWQERDGPPVKVPERRGFGSRLLERGLTHGSGRTARLDYAPLGVECRISVPLTAAGDAA